MKYENQSSPLAQAIRLHDNNAAKLARALTSSGYKASGASVRNWLVRGVPLEACFVIEKVCAGKVTLDQLRAENQHIKKNRVTVSQVHGGKSSDFQQKVNVLNN